ncbi:uncharacterized protein PGTG_04115 [Puccinia graminis f. sp. tritici CRL 75-36-700-3]|uniref:NF-X1-type domain-containing protein n=1 Tax=Puccinia graminis f. sp. tritici (strain CRL 75-36-700-3 / race SCCL) TaxID=418459 RepID=E3K1I4_PUCGT|nr:uncharacterized protein PGTG_04115 [Puccinia graminis f. sp. tritici CRL 75-36-700-3]EFP78159.2 hypothetical protein PGTG_04115 [Puccinia graminis f. sp. tritici CRL 75-36-700-3]
MSSQPQPQPQPTPNQGQQPAATPPITTTVPPTGVNTTNRKNSRNNRSRNNHSNRNGNGNGRNKTNQSTSSNPNNRSQRRPPINPNQSNQQHPQNHQYQPKPNNRQASPHLDHSNPPPSSNLTLNHSKLLGLQKPSRNDRRKAFGSKLTDETQQTASNQEPKKSTPLNPVDLSLLSLSARLIVELSSSTYDCSICISPIGPYNPIYHCPKCYAIFHLNCSIKWASCSVADTSAKALLLRDRDRIPCSEEALKGEWRCPGCQDRQIGQASIPKKYTCWCGKLENPTSRNNQHHQAGRKRSKIPHGCGKRCGKVAAEGCTHGCMEECHPGSCAPCPAVIKTKCHCQKTELAIRCSQLYTNSTYAGPMKSELLSCGQVCNAQLSCGLHSCEQICHQEKCEECTAIRQKSCYCGHLVLADQKCSDQVASHPFTPQPDPEKLTCVSKDGTEWLGEFACKDPCDWMYDCGIHPCQSTCHPHLVSTPPPCPFSPALANTCPCGATSLSDRQTCADPISTCHNPCGKMLASCGHACPKVCHLGPCGPCQSLVTTLCNCGKDKIVRRCTELEELKKLAILENEQKILSERQDPESVKALAIEYRCERPCRVLRHCGKHTCHRRCCPLSFLENVLQTGSKNKKSEAARHHEHEDTLGLHVCDLKCNKKLSCGLHSCQLQDHRGPCPTCLQASFDEWFCHCGATVIQPPVPCGTKIDCHAPCQRPPPSCGHPKPPHTCHEEPDCPPCPYLTEKACQCDKKKLVKNVRCSQPKVSCGTTCDNLLACGAHRCSRQCHSLGQCESCDRDCLKPRKHCGHGCQQKCHAPSACRTEEPCEATIEMQCECGRITQKIKCASCDSRPEGNQGRGLKCNDDCILAQRNLAVANALQITKPSSTESQALEDIQWNTRLLNFFGTHASFAKRMEEQLADFLKSELSPKSTSTKNSLIISPFSKLNQAFLLEFVTYYRIKPEIISQEPQFTVKLVKDSSSCLPRILLSEAHTNNPDTKRTSVFSASGVSLLRNPGSANGSSSGIGARELSVACSPNQILAIMFEGVFGYDHQSLTGLIKSALDSKNIGRKGNPIKFRLNWINDEDVLFRLSSSSSSSSSLTTRTKSDFEELETIGKTLVVYFSHSESLEGRSNSDRKKFYRSIVLVKVDLLEDYIDEGPEEKGLKVQKIERIGSPTVINPDSHQGWKSSSSSASNKKLHSKLFDHSQHPQHHTSSNRFSSLLSSSSTSVNRASAALHPFASTSTAVGSFSSGVISGGFNRPPIAVLAPSSSTSHPIGARSNSKQKLHKEEDVVDDWETAV